MDTMFTERNWTWNNALNSKWLIWAVLCLYVTLTCMGMYHHELWGDELQAWNIAKGSSSLPDLFRNTRFEGHPPAWYIILWFLSKFTHHLIFVQVVHLVIAISIVYLILFYSPFPTLTKVLLPFGYFFQYEYALLSRNYAIGILSGIFICIVMHKEFKHKFFLYYSLLFIMTNTHLFALLLAGSLHLFFLMTIHRKNKNRNSTIFHILLGLLIFSPAIYIIYPPSDATATMPVLLHYWDLRQLAVDIQSPIRAFLPMPAWWKLNCWNTQFFLELHNTYAGAKFINLLFASGFVASAIFVLRKNKKCVVLFIANLIATFIVGNIYVLSPERYCGFIFIGFIFAYWLYCYSKPILKAGNAIVNILLVFQVAAGVFMIYKDIELPFSNGYKASTMVNQTVGSQKVITDYLSLNTISSSLEGPFYCVDIQQEAFFLQWGSFSQMRKNPNRYCTGVTNFFQKEGIKTTYLISTLSPTILAKTDSKFFLSFQVELVNKREGAIEKESNIYLYKITFL